MWPPLLLLGCHPTGSVPEPDPAWLVEQRTDVVSGLHPVATPFALGDLERWSLDDESLPQHHAAATWTPDGHLAVAWTLDEMARLPEVWVRVEEPGGERLGEPVQLGVGMRAAKPDVHATSEGLVVGFELDRIGLAVAEIALPSLEVTHEAGLAPESSAVGNNSLDLAVRDDGEVFAAWYEGDWGLPGAFLFGGLGAGGDRVGERIFALTDHEWPAPPDIAVLPNGGAAVAWSRALQGESVEVWITTFDAGRDPRGVYAVGALGAGQPIPPRPSLAVNSAGELALGYNAELPSGQTESRLTFLALDGGGLHELQAPWSIGGPDTDLVVVSFLGDDAVVAAWMGPGDEVEASVWMSVVGFPGGETLVAPRQISAPGRLARRPNLAVRALDDGRHEWIVVWEQENDEGVRTVWSRRAIR